MFNLVTILSLDRDSLRKTLHPVKTMRLIEQQWSQIEKKEDNILLLEIIMLRSKSIFLTLTLHLPSVLFRKIISHLVRRSNTLLCLIYGNICFASVVFLGQKNC